MADDRDYVCTIPENMADADIESLMAFVRERGLGTQTSGAFSMRACRTKGRLVLQRRRWLTSSLDEIAFLETPDALAEFGSLLSRQRPVIMAYHGSNAAASRRVCKALEDRGTLGWVAAALFRVQKASSRAKVYRGGLRHTSYRNLAYDRKNDQLIGLVVLLEDDDCSLVWGWGSDDGGHAVLYVELPTGQVSFHATQRLTGPDYRGVWDRQPGQSEPRIIEFCEDVLRAGNANKSDMAFGSTGSKACLVE
jgi:hypothetical protein